MPTKEKNKIIKTGYFFELDKNGFIVNPSSLDKIDEDWMTPINDAVKEILKYFDFFVRYIYVRGSVARGTAVKNTSNLNIIAVITVNTPEDVITDSGVFLLETKKKILQNNSFIKDLRINIYKTKNIFDNIEGCWHMFNDAICVYKNSQFDIISPKVKINEYLITYLYHLENYLLVFDDICNSKSDEKQICDLCIAFMKIVIRSAFELTIIPEGKYCKDLYLCCKTFIKYYPEKEEEIMEVLNLAINPTSDIEEIKRIRNNICSFILEEYKKNKIL